MATRQLLAGYECSLVEDLPSELQTECSVCLHILREPYIVSCCGYRFCRTCIEQVLKSKTTRRCPLCNNGFSTLPDKHLDRVLKDKLVYCCYKALKDGSIGCKWKGKLVDLEDHTQKCNWQKVRCPHCDETIMKMFTKFHLNHTCSARHVTCTYCKVHKDSKPKLESVHYAVCPMYPVACPNNCGAKPFRKNISSHFDESCPLTVTDCFFKHAGCDVRLTRRAMKQHSESNLAEHLAMSMSKIMELKRENSRIKDQLDSKESELKSQPTSRQVKYLSVTNLADCVNESMLNSVFGQYGAVRRVSLIEDFKLAIIEYYAEASARHALSRSESRGINLKSHRLCLSPVYES